MPRADVSLSLALLALGVLSAGCMTMGTNNITNDRLENGLLVYVEDSSDARDRGWKAFEDGLSNRGVSLAVEHFNWSPKLLGLAGVGLPDRTESGQAGIDLARNLRNYAVAYPGRPIYVVGHGVGAHIALNALEELDPRFPIDRLVLLMPNIDGHRNLSSSLAQVRDRALVYYSNLNVVHGLAGPMVFGTHDTARSRPHASMAGLSIPEHADPAQYDKLHAYSWRPSMALRGNLGMQNLGPTSPLFVRKFIVPFLLDGVLLDPHEDDLGMVPD